MGSLTDDLDILQGNAEALTPPAIGQPVMPRVGDRTVYVSACVTANVLVSLNLIRILLEVSDDGNAWETADAGQTSAGALSLFRTLDGHTKLGAFVRAGQQYRFSTGPLGTGGTATVQELHETTIEISSHRSVAFEYLSGATAVPDNSHMHECGAPCFTPSLFIDQYKRDPSEGYRSFEAGVPPKGYVRALAGAGSGGTANPLDDATGNHDLTLLYADQPAPMPSTIAAFNGGRMLDGFHALTAGTNFDNLSAFTIDVHIVASTDITGAVILAVWEIGFEQVRLSVDANGFAVFEAVDGAGTMQTAQGAININDQQSHWLRAVHDGENIVILIDGVVDTSTSCEGLRAVGANAAVVLGRSDAQAASESSAIGIDEVRLSNIVRDGGGPYVPINVPFAVDSNTVNLWHLDGEVGMNGDHLVVMGDATAKGVEIGSPTIVDDGPFGKAVRIDGNSYIEIGSNFIRAAGVQVLGYGCFFRIVGDPTEGRLSLISKWNGQSTNNWLAECHINGGTKEIVAEWAAAGFTQQNECRVSAVPYIDGQWHYIALIKRAATGNGTNEMWIDGVMVDSVLGASLPATNPSVPVRFGGTFSQGGTPPNFAVDIADAWSKGISAPPEATPSAGVAVPTVPVTMVAGENHRHFPMASAQAIQVGVSAGNLLVKGRKTDEGATDSFTLNWRGTTYTEADPEIVFPSPTTWEFQGDPGPDVGAPGELMTVKQDGQPDQQVAICVDRTAPAASLTFNGMSVGTDGLDPMYRGEYAKLLPTYADAGVGVESAALVYENPSYWTGEPTNAPASGVATGYFRSSANAPTTGGTDITLRAEDKAGNVAQDTVTVFFGNLPVQSSVSLSDLTGAQRPAHLNETEYAETAYDDVALGATVNISPVPNACRNSGQDDTRSQLLSGGLSIDPETNNDIAGQSASVHATGVSPQTSRIGVGIIGRVRDQYYRNIDSVEAGDYAYNASRAIDFGLDQTIGIGSPPFTGKAVEPFTDEHAGDNLTDCRIFDGAAEWLANGAVLDVTLSLASNNGQLFQPRLFDKAGAELLFATYGADVDVKLHDGTSFVGPVSGDSFGPNASYDLPALNGAASVQARITVANTSVPPLGAFIMNYKA